MKLYLYLGKRDKKGARVITVLNHKEKCNPCRMMNLQTLGIPQKLSAEIEKIVSVVATRRACKSLKWLFFGFGAEIATQSGGDENSRCGSPLKEVRISWLLTWQEGFS